MAEGDDATPTRASKAEVYASLAAQARQKMGASPAAPTVTIRTPGGTSKQLDQSSVDAMWEATIEQRSPAPETATLAEARARIKDLESRLDRRGQELAEAKRRAMNFVQELIQTQRGLQEELERAKSESAALGEGHASALGEQAAELERAREECARLSASHRSLLARDKELERLRGEHAELGARHAEAEGARAAAEIVQEAAEARAAEAEARATEAVSAREAAEEAAAEAEALVEAGAARIAEAEERATTEGARASEAEAELSVRTQAASNLSSELERSCLELERTQQRAFDAEAAELELREELAKARAATATPPPGCGDGGGAGSAASPGEAEAIASLREAAEEVASLRAQLEKIRVEGAERDAALAAAEEALAVLAPEAVKAAQEGTMPPTAEIALTPAPVGRTMPRSEAKIVAEGLDSPRPPLAELLAEWTIESSKEDSVLTNPTMGIEAVMEYAADWSDALKSIADDFSWLYAAPAPASDAPAPASAGVAVAEIVDESKDSKDAVVRF